MVQVWKVSGHILMKVSPKVRTIWKLIRELLDSTTDLALSFVYSKMSPACDVGTIYNQTTPEGIPASNARGGRTAFNGKYNTESLSWLQGQRLSACTCAGEDHPGPKLSDGSFKGRGAVEIDVFEAQVGKGKADPSIRTMQVSQSAQVSLIPNRRPIFFVSLLFRAGHSLLNSY